MDTQVIQIETWRDALVASFSKAFDQIITLAPNLLAMIVVLAAGYLVARVLQRAVTALSASLGFQTAADRSGLSDSMKQVGITNSLPAILGLIVFWLTICVFLTAAFNILGLATVSAAMDRIVSYIPNVLAATVLVVVGLLVASLLRGVVATSADRVGLSYAETLANGCYWVLVAMVLIGALDQLKIEFGLLEELITIAFAAVALGFGLAFGLGGRDVMGGILSGYYVRQRLRAGDHVSVAGYEGTVREVGPVSTIVETMEDGLLNRHSIPNSKMLNEAVR